jgi:hypothetical protein
MIETLLSHGFVQQAGTNVYALRISILTFVEYDLEDGFLTFHRQSESLKRPDRVILPKPIRDVETFKTFMSFLR